MKREPNKSTKGRRNNGKCGPVIVSPCKLGMDSVLIFHPPQAHRAFQTASVLGHLPWGVTFN